MQSLQPIEHSNQRILTTHQLAEAYGTDVTNIITNFNRNKDRYTSGKHYFCLEGDDLKNFKAAYPQIVMNLKFAPIAYLWTEKGAWLHAKSLNTDRAWEAYEKLVDDYYHMIHQQPQQQALPGLDVSSMTFSNETLERLAREIHRLQYHRKQGARSEKRLSQMIVNPNAMFEDDLEPVQMIEADPLTPEQVAMKLENEILRQLTRSNERSGTEEGMSATALHDYIKWATRKEIDEVCHNLVKRGVIGVERTSHTVKYTYI